ETVLAPGRAGARLAERAARGAARGAAESTRALLVERASAPRRHRSVGHVRAVRHVSQVEVDAPVRAGERRGVVEATARAVTVIRDPSGVDPGLNRRGAVGQLSG